MDNVVRLGILHWLVVVVRWTGGSVGEEILMVRVGKAGVSESGMGWKGWGQCERRDIIDEGGGRLVVAQ